MGLCSCFFPASPPSTPADPSPEPAKPPPPNDAGFSSIGGRAGGERGGQPPAGRRASGTGVPGLNTGAAIKVAEKELAGGGAAAAADAAGSGAAGAGAAGVSAAEVAAPRPGHHLQGASLGVQAPAGLAGGDAGGGRSQPLSEFGAKGLGKATEIEPQAPSNNADDPNLVRDGDGRCVPGASVVVSQDWLAVPYFAQFTGLRGKLTRRGVSGVTWYAEFPGLFEQAFSTGMHGQHVLAYAPAGTASQEGGETQTPPSKTQLYPLAGAPLKKPSVPPASTSQQHAKALNQAMQPPPRTAFEAHGMGSSRKERLPSARSRAVMGAPPLGSSRSGMASARSGRKPMDGLRVGATPRDGDLTSRESRKGRLFKYPEWEEYELFDSDDLWSEYAYLLYGEPDKGGNHVYIWVGQYMEELELTDEASCQAFSRKAVSQFKAIMGGWPVGPVTVVRELEEPEAFWEYFAWG